MSLKQVLPRMMGLLVAFVSLIGCLYQLRGTGSSLPPHIQKIQVPMFKNSTTRYQLDVKLTLSVIDELVARGKVEVVSDSDAADAILIGEITSFRPVPIAFDTQAAADRYNIIIQAKITLRDLSNNRVIYSNSNYIFQEEYEVTEGTDFESVQLDAIENISLKFARNLVVTILEGF